MDLDFGHEGIVSASQGQPFLAALGQVLAADQIERGDAQRHLHSADFSEENVFPALAVLRPRSAEDISHIVKLAARHGVAVSARGGGMSYTRSHTPQQLASVVLDMGAMDAILEIDTVNRFVAVEPGVTWQKLRDALAPTGYRVPYLGTLSGMIATVGGGASQNATGMGRMTLAEHIMGLEVVLGDGRIVRTGSSVTTNTLPFYRYNGPDFTGVFLCDSGAFGFKTRLYLHLEPVPAASYGCVAFASRSALVRAQAELAASGLHTEAFAFDEYFVEQYARHPKPSKPEVKRMLGSYFAHGRNRNLRGLVNLLRAWHPEGLRFLAGRGTVMYYISEGHDQAAADRARRRVDGIMRRHGGTIIPASIPFALRHGPFLTIGDMMTNGDGEVNYPVNAKFAASQAELAMQGFESFLAEHKAELETHGVRLACNTLLHGHFFGIEPVVFWKKPLSDYRASFATDAARSVSARTPDDATCNTYATGLRYRLAKRFREIGALHVQWGRVYGYADALRTPEIREFVTGFKQLVDPGHIVNPGVLGL